ncbi:BMP family ABC transporter substrate-binding protein [Mycetocola manganoxydans]|uniref:BMP family ABC transporter substrate-binding protein n=1 Tax=Mycetocola manganoxydans TaxID=699879 RepID=A0A3L7A3R1_9MICO|nr:BMP family ABC transporter substrate-binding protein [Mycetocola manganoxydans]RLP73912.1 BMP family ABC transporter substrate-binding protein [Mycetocola manganoxydans]GHD42354.1 BMP family ABC transporter substrate-binding protein [Mycetocola manganoxydans]
MTINTRKVAFAGLATAGVIALLAGCGQAPAADNGNGSEGEALDFTPCMVSDAGGFDDKSFNQLGFEGLTEAAEELGVEPITVESAAETDYGPNVENLVDQGCDLIVTVGFLLAEATGAAAAANPDVKFTIIDDYVDLDSDGATDSENIKPIVFNTAEAAFLAGYAAASYSKTGVVGTFGGIPIPPVTIFMDGFVDGVNHYNEVKDADVKALGWDVAAQNGSFTGGFEVGVDAQNLAQGLIDQNADVLLPVGGPIFQSAISAIRDSGKEIAMIGVDADLYETFPDGADLFLTSILKGMKVGVNEVVLAAADDEFDGTPFVGTLENEGVGIAPFHDFEGKVDAELQAELDEIRAGIIDGSIEVTSPSSP